MSVPNGITGTVTNSVQARSLWIGDVEYWMDEGFLIKIFQEVANVKNLKIIRDKTKNTNLGYGFVEFESQEMARDVLKELNGRPIPDTNKTLKLNWASYSAGKQAAMSNAPVTDYSIYVGDLEASVSEEKLKDYFSKFYSTVIGAKIIVDPVNKTSKGYGFVKFSDQSEAQRALSEMSGKILNGKPLKTNQASFKKMNSDSNLLSNQSNQGYNQFFNNYSAYASDPNSYSPNSGLFSFSQGMNYNSTGSSTGNKYQNSNNYLNTNSSSSSLTNLNNFYMQNTGDYNSDNSSSLGNNYNLSNFYYNNMNNVYFQNMMNPYYTYTPNNNSNFGSNNSGGSFNTNNYTGGTSTNGLNNHYYQSNNY